MMEKKALLSLSFDDGRRDNYDIIKKTMIPMHLPVTINITTGYVDGTCTEENKPSSKPALIKSEIIELFEEPLVEIALHGDQHLNTEEDITIGRNKLLEWFHLPEDTKFGFASPGSGLSVTDFIKSESTFFKNDILYLRTSLRISSKGKLRILCRKVGRIIHAPILYKIAYTDTIMNAVENRVIYSIPVLKDVSVSQVEAVIDECIKQKGALTLMFHSIAEDVSSDDNWSWSKNKFEQLCRYLVHKQELGVLEICTTKDLYEKICKEPSKRDCMI